MGEKGGRSLRGVEETGFVKYNVTLPPSIVKRLDKYMEDEERARSWCIQKALDVFSITPSGY